MTTLNTLPNSLATYRDGSLTFPVRIIAAKFVYGHTVVTITPVGGAGTRLVRLSKITLTK